METDMTFSFAWFLVTVLVTFGIGFTGLYIKKLQKEIADLKEGKIQRLVIEYQLDTKQLEIDLNELREKLKTVVKKENIGDVV